MEEIVELIRRIAGQGRIEIAVGSVVSVDEDTRTCLVQPIDDTAEIHNVRLQASESLNGGLYLKPLVDSFVVVGFFDENSAVVLLCSEVEKIYLNGDTYGVAKTEELIDELNKTKAVVEAIADSLLNWVAVPQDGGAALQLYAAAALAGKSTGSYDNTYSETIRHG